MKKIATSILSIFVGLMTFAQTSLEEIIECPEKAGGVYYAYPVSESLNTSAPKGYKPFYISHYGRHGSRYLIADKDYRWVIDRMQDAHDKGALNTLGEDVLVRLDSVWIEAQGRGGELTPLGRKQHHDIATRMYNAYPEAFAGNPRITAASTPVMRCAHSMFAFLEGLKEKRPDLNIPYESSPRNMYYLNYHSPESGKYTSNEGPWYQEQNKMFAEYTHPDRLMNTLFADSTYVRRWVNPSDLMWGLYWIAVDMQNMDTPVTFMDIFTPEELFDLWQVINYGNYAKDGSYPLLEGTVVDNAKNLLRDILNNADAYISSGENGATLRFGHDGNILPLATLLQFPGALSTEMNPQELYKSYANFKISPMGSNIQIVFFRNPKKSGADDEILVKFMLNEREVPIPDTPSDLYPFYRWPEARATLQHLLDTPSIEFHKQTDDTQCINDSLETPQLSF